VLQARTLPKPSLYSEWIHGISSGLPELDEKVRAVPGEVTVLDVGVRSMVSSEPSAAAAVNLVLTWASALACKENFKFDIFCDYAQPEHLICELQHYGKCRRRQPADQLAWTLQHFNCQHADATSLLSDALVAMQHAERIDTAMRGVVVLMGDGVKEKRQVLRRTAVQLKQLARATQMHVWVVRLCGHRRDPCDELHNICDNYLTVESTVKEAKVCVQKVRNQFAGNASLQPLCLKYSCS